MPPTSPDHRAGVTGALLLVQVFFGLHYLAAKVVLDSIPPRAWASLRIGAAALVLLAVLRLAGRRLPHEPRDWLRLAVLAVFGVGINQLCFVEGLSRTTPTHSALINTTIPVNTLLIAVLLGRERIRLRKVLALLIAFGGVLLIIRPWAGDVSATMRTGDLLTLINATSFAFFLVISKRLLARIDPLGATTALVLLGALGIGLVGVPQLAGFHPAAVPAHVWWLAAFIVLLPTAGAYLINYWALARVESSLVAFFIFLQPAIAAALSAIFLGERLAVPDLVGGALIVLAVLLAARRSRGRGF